jgi:hypothetical protein
LAAIPSDLRCPIKTLDKEKAMDHELYYEDPLPFSLLAQISPLPYGSGPSYDGSVVMVTMSAPPMP